MLKWCRGENLWEKFKRINQTILSKSDENCNKIFGYKIPANPVVKSTPYIDNLDDLISFLHNSRL